MDERNRQNRSSFLWPILLILVGVVFLLNNLGFIDSVTWDSIWRLWPLIFIAIGLDGLVRRSEIVGPVIMFSLGIAILLNNFGWYWSAWGTIWRLWPIFIIAIGFEIMLGRRSPWISAIGILVVLGILGGLIWLSGAGIEPLGGQPMHGEAIDQELGEATRANITIAPAVGELNIDPLEDSNTLIAGNVSAGSRQDVWSSYQLQGSTAFYTMKNRNPLPIPGDGWAWNLGLTPDIPIELDTSMGAGDMNLDLYDLSLTRLDASQGVGELSVALPTDVSINGDISQAIGQIVITVPEDVSIRLEISRAISNLDLPRDFEKRGDYYYSPGYETADERIDLEVSQAIGNIEIRYSK